MGPRSTHKGARTGHNTQCTPGRQAAGTGGPAGLGGQGPIMPPVHSRQSCKQLTASQVLQAFSPAAKACSEQLLTNSFQRKASSSRRTRANLRDERRVSWPQAQAHAEGTQEPERSGPGGTCPSRRSSKAPRLLRHHLGPATARLRMAPGNTCPAVPHRLYCFP